MRDNHLKGGRAEMLGCRSHHPLALDLPALAVLCQDLLKAWKLPFDHGVPKIDPTGPVPPYLQVAEFIRSQIRSGKLRTGNRITEAEITETYEVARSTARRTLAVLRDEGLIYTVPSAGATYADGIQEPRTFPQLRPPAFRFSAAGIPAVTPVLGGKSGVAAVR